MTLLRSVWATGQSSPRGQLRQGLYVSATAHDTDRVPPAVARLAIDHLTAPGDTVLDPDCGAGTVPVEALRASRHAIAITDTRRWWSVARANLTATRRTGTHTDALLLDGTPAAPPDNWPASPALSTSFSPASGSPRPVDPSTPCASRSGTACR